jgi:hypothetical protein
MLPLSLATAGASVPATGWAAIGAFVAGAAEAQAERSKLNKLMAKNKFLVINLAFMAFPLFFI